MKTSNREIGSIFYEVEVKDAPNNIYWQDGTFSFSGRTSLLQIIDDIMEKGGIKNAYLPSYCCESMIEPFVRRKIEVHFYDILLEEGQLKYSFDSTDKDVDIILSMNYFGIGTKETRDFELKIKENYPEAVIIKDATHSLFSTQEVDDLYDYTFASLRKWSGFADGGFLLKKPPAIKTLKDVNTMYLDKFNEAKVMKKEYIENGTGNKSDFLNLFNEAEETLDRDYERYSISPQSFKEFQCFDIKRVSRTRKDNWQVLSASDDVFENKNIMPLFRKSNENEVPLFFPVVFNSKEERDKFRKYLIENNVYCPIHWPASNLHSLNEKTREIYDFELSIVCDQRYGIEDMRSILQLVNKY